MKIITCIAPVNIAVIKYWGKRCEELILPINDSLSGTLSTEQMFAKTTIMISPNFKEDKIWLNGNEENFDNKRLQNCLNEIKKRCKNELTPEMLLWKIHICSENNFPTAAGLASSAAGYACLVFALAELYSIKSDISSIARMGSGSACRSIYGGWVQWFAGTKSDGSDSIAKQIVSADYWPEVHILILVVNDIKKKIGSTVGMKNTIQTSELFKYRVEKCVPDRINKIKQAILDKDFETFGRITMQESNQLHALCLDTYPPCVYMNDVSHNIVQFVHKFNEFHGQIQAAYTFDAGPNACIYILKNSIELFVKSLNQYFPPGNNTVEYLKGIPINLNETKSISLPLDMNKAGLLKYIIHTQIGDGPKVLNNYSEHLLNDNGFPKILST